MTESALHGAIQDRRERLTKLGLLIIFTNTLVVFVLILATMVLPMFIEILDTPVERLLRASFNNHVLVIFISAATTIDLLGFGILLVGLSVWKIRHKWFYRWMQIASVAVLFHGPVGIPMYFAVSRYLEMHKHEFLAPGDVPRRPLSVIV
jgi:hypothetical protein